ncbi:hypothetical protein RHSIM_Rhsim05G0218000 [Rhododendron simsii]|uniref:Uncharacterized protein n=1 Tax=Rhododendron simsii TaxID=118357 RepID=A0A834LNE2_RHOSS|nr:hypothetical protein RHSIM_Rhsim05G0218000 [Rhododendron simsii]
MVWQFDLPDFWLNKPDEMVGRRIVWSLLGITRWAEEYFKDMKYAHKSAVIVPSLLFDPILTFPDLHERRAVEEDPLWKEFLNEPLELQIINLHFATDQSATIWKKTGMVQYLNNTRCLPPIRPCCDLVSERICSSPPAIKGEQDVRAACQSLLAYDVFRTRIMVVLVRSKEKDERWEMLKLMWVRIYAMYRGK